MITDFPIVYSQNDLLQVSSCLLGLFKDKFKVKNVLIVGLTGDLGTGKTTLCKEILRQLQVSGPVVSPTFVLRKDYEGILDGEKLDIIHIDAYRLEKKEQIQQVLGKGWSVEFSLYENKVLILVEWIELSNLKADIQISIHHRDGQHRCMEVVYCA